MAQIVLERDVQGCTTGQGARSVAADEIGWFWRIVLTCPVLLV